jgi:hypothetical protein
MSHDIQGIPRAYPGYRGCQMSHDIQGMLSEYSFNEFGIANIPFDQLELCLSNEFLNIPPLDSRIVEFVEVVQTHHPMAFPK